MRTPPILFFGAALFALLIGSRADAQIPLNANLQDQSTFALGTFRMNVIFLESDGSIDTSQENWQQSQINKVKSEVNQAVSYWEGLTDDFHPNARLSIDVNYVNDAQPIDIGYEPINRSSTQDHLWINDALNTLGYNDSNKFTNVRNFNQDQRIEGGTNWSGTIFIANDLIDDDNRFSNSAFAYSHVGGPYTMMTYGNNGWGADRFNIVLSHELSHYFFALDEYAGSGERITNRSGYLNGVNGNAELDSSGNNIVAPQPDALLLNNTLDPSPFTLTQIGHLDTDGDSIPDILDTFPILAGEDSASDPLTGDFVFSGSADVNPLNNLNPKNRGFSNSQADITINWIDGAEYNLDGSGWQTFAASDGAFDGFSEDLSLSVLGLSGGMHAIDIRARNSVDNYSDLLRFNFDSANPVPEPSTLVLSILAVASAGVWLGKRNRSASTVRA